MTTQDNYQTFKNISKYVRDNPGINQNPALKSFFILYGFAFAIRAQLNDDLHPQVMKAFPFLSEHEYSYYLEAALCVYHSTEIMSHETFSVIHN